jgi:phage tail-like protein
MANYPLAAYHFRVSWNNQDIGFSDVSGLTQELQSIEYRDGLMAGTTPSLRRPGIKKVNNISLKRGIVEKNNDLFNWFNNNGGSNIERRDITIALLNDEGNPVMVWGISQAFPVKCEGPTLKATGNDIAIESIELCHEGISLKTV